MGRDLKSGPRGGFIPQYAPDGDLGPFLGRTPTNLGSFTSASNGAATGIQIDCDKFGWIEFGGLGFGGWAFAYAENPNKFRPIYPGDMYPASAVGRILLKEVTSGEGYGQVDVQGWSYETGYVRAMTSRNARAMGDNQAYDNAVILGGTKYGATQIGPGVRSVCSFYGESDAAITLTVQYSLDGVDYYDSEVEVVLAGAGTFAIDFLTAAPYVAFAASANANVLANFSWR